MEKKQTGLSLDFIIHPGETIKEALDDRGITQKQLAEKCGVTEQQISRVIRGTSNISMSLAKKLEYAIGIDASFWLNLQANYDAEYAEYMELENVSAEELGILKHLKDIVNKFVEFGFIQDGTTPRNKVLELRKRFGIANLTLIPKQKTAAYYRQSMAVSADIYVIYAWHKLCDLIADGSTITNALETSLLRKNVENLKKCLLIKNVNEAILVAKKILGKCGINFNVVPHFKGAPIQGFIRETESGSVNLCLTIRQGKADIFWFSFFHEIGHILNGDVDGNFTDYEKEVSDIENRADEFARDMLLNPYLFEKFLKDKDFSITKIKAFAKENKVPPYIVIGRLQKERYLGWNEYSSYKTTYKWSEKYPPTLP